MAGDPMFRWLGEMGGFIGDDSRPQYPVGLMQ